MNPFLGTLDYFLVGQPGVRLLAKGEDLPEQNSKGPDVGLRREFPVEE